MARTDQIHPVDSAAMGGMHTSKVPFHTICYQKRAGADKDFFVVAVRRTSFKCQ